MCIRDSYQGASARQVSAIYAYQQAVLKAYVEVVNQLSEIRNLNQSYARKSEQVKALSDSCLLYTSDAADERSSVDLGGRRIIKKKKQKQHTRSNRSYKHKSPHTPSDNRQSHETYK